MAQYGAISRHMAQYDAIKAIWGVPLYIQPEIKKKIGSRIEDLVKGNYMIILLLSYSQFNFNQKRF